MTQTSTTITATFRMERATKNTYRFHSDDEESGMDTLYVRKGVFATEPRTIELTLVVTD